jgi:putative aldouronate transport system substrate-binding protein
MNKKLLVSIVLFSMILQGCFSQDTSQTEPSVFSVLYNEKESSPLNEDWAILEEYVKRQNVVLDVQSGNDADYEKELLRIFESENIPDIVLKVWPNSIKQYASDGILLPFSDYEDKMPNFMAYIQEHNLQSELDKLRLENGKYYILPGYQRQIQVQQWIYRRDIFEQNNLEMPETYDQLFDALVTLKEIYPDTTPITATWGGAHLFAMMGAGYGIPAGWSGTRYYNLAGDEWLYAPATDNYKAMYSFLNRCYTAGILDLEIFTLSDKEFINRIQDGRALVTVTWITSGFDNWNEKLKENGYPDGEWAPLPVPESTIGIKALPPVDPFRKGLVVPSRVLDEPYFEDLIKFLDWAVYSEEGMTLTTWGIEGLTYEITPEGKVYLPHIITPKNTAGTVDITSEYGFDSIFNLNENEEFENYKKPVEIEAFLDRSLKAGETLELPPQLTLSSDSIEAISMIDEKINSYVAETGTKFITGEWDIEENWDNYLNELEIRGYKTLEAIWNADWEDQNK